MTEFDAEFHSLEGTFRSRKPADTLSWLQPYLKSMGITRVANITGLDHLGIHVTTCIRPQSKHLSVSQGKGRTLELADISAIMESIEGFHFENPSAEEIRGKYPDLIHHYKLIDPNRFNRTDFKRDLHDVNLGWVAAKNLVDNKDYYIPHMLTFLDTTQDHEEYAYLKTSSNGIAAGNTLDEAVCHALYEVIERDSIAQWQRLTSDEQRKTQVDLQAVTDKSNRVLLEKFHAANIKVKVWEVTSNIGLPAFHCAIDDENVLRGLGMFTGTGAHLSKDIALSRALTEAAQSRLTLISGNRDDIFPEYYQRVNPSNKMIGARMFAQGTRNYQDCSSLEIKASLADNLHQMISLLTKNNCLEVLLVDHTKKQFGIPVVQVFIPDMLCNSTRM